MPKIKPIDREGNLDLEIIENRSKEGGHYSWWLYVPFLIEEVRTLRNTVENLLREQYLRENLENLDKA